jgi:hypothetical protein
MTDTILAKQLANLKAKQSDEIKLSKKSIASFLFEVDQASNIDSEIIYSIGTVLTG